MECLGNGRIAQHRPEYRAPPLLHEGHRTTVDTEALMRLAGVPPESDVVEAMSNGTGSRLTLDHGRFDRALFERLRKKVLHYVEDGNTKVRVTGNVHVALCCAVASPGETRGKRGRSFGEFQPDLMEAVLDMMSTS